MINNNNYNNKKNYNFNKIKKLKNKIKKNIIN